MKTTPGEQKPSEHSARVKLAMALMFLLALAGCGNDAEKLTKAVKELETVCAVPLRIEIRAGTWSREGIFACEEVKRGELK